MSQKHELQIRKLEQRVKTLEDRLADILPSTNLTETNTAYEVVHKGWGKFSIWGPEGEIASNLTREAAHAQVSVLNGGH